MRCSSFLFVAIVASLAGAPWCTLAGDAMRYVYHPPESALDRRYDFTWEVLRAALERTLDAYGPYEMTPSAPMSEHRQMFEMQHATGRLTVMFQTTTPELERTLIPVHIPVDRGLIGYRVFLIRKGDQARFDAVRTTDDLRELTLGQGLGWVDVGILRHDGFRVLTGSDYDGLFHMLVNRRFDAFPRAVVEILDEYRVRRERLPGLAIEKHLVLYYPLPTYFWFPKTKEGERLAGRVREGMMAMIDDGTYDRLFFAYQGDKIEQLDLKNRRVFRVANPLLGPETPFDDRRLWFDPTTDPVPTTRPAR